MEDTHARKFQRELNGGLVGLVLLAVLDQADEDLYGYEIAKRLTRSSPGGLLFKEGTIYPVLRALSAGGLTTSRIVPSYSGPPRRYYRITAEGRSVLREWRNIWRETRDFVDRFATFDDESPAGPSPADRAAPPAPSAEDKP